MENDDVKVVVEKKKGFKERVAERYLKFKEFCIAHPDGVLTVLSGVITLTSGVLYVCGNKNEYKNSVFTEIDGKIYKVPAKEMKTVNKGFTAEEQK